MSQLSTEESSYQSLMELLSQGEYEACIRGCMEHIEEFGDSAKIWVLAGTALGADNRPDQARKALLCALELDPSHENAQVNYVTSCFHGGHKEDALKAINEFLPDMSDDCLAFKLAPCLAEALEIGALESTDLNPRIWIRIESILDSVEDQLEQEIEDEDNVVAKDNVIQFPLQGPRPLQVIEKPYPLAHWIFEGGKFRSATLYVEGDHFHLKAYDSYIASPLGLVDSRGESVLIRDPRHLAEYLFAQVQPKMLSFLKLCRQDWDHGDEVFFYFESFSLKDKKLCVNHLVESSRFEEENYHFKKDAIVDIRGGGPVGFSEQESWSGFRRLSDLWSPPYLGEIVFSELKKELEKLKVTKKKAS